MPFVNVTINLSWPWLDYQLIIKTLISHDVLFLQLEAVEAVARRYQAGLHGLTPKNLNAALEMLYPLGHVNFFRIFNAA